MNEYICEGDDCNCSRLINCGRYGTSTLPKLTKKNAPTIIRELALHIIDGNFELQRVDGMYYKLVFGDIAMYMLIANKGPTFTIFNVCGLKIEDDEISLAYTMTSLMPRSMLAIKGAVYEQLQYVLATHS